MRNPTAFLIAVCAAAGLASASHNPDARRLRDAGDVLKSAASRPAYGLQLSRAECIGIFPGVADGEPRAGGDFGHGVVMCRRHDGTMGAPAFFMISGGIAGATDKPRSDLVLLVMNADGVNRLRAGRVSLEGGPKQVPFQAWARADGSFQEVSLDGSVLEPDTPTTVTFYGSPVPPKDILQDQALVAPKAAEPLVRLASQLAKRTS
jgi:lipid-binding SYLF domain-containing protein